MNQSSTTQVNAGNGHSDDLAKIKGQIIEEILKDFSMASSDPVFIAILTEILDQSCHLEHSLFSETIEGNLNELIEKLSPLIPRPTLEDETCSLYMQDLLSKAFFLRVMLRLGNNGSGCGSSGGGDTNGFQSLENQDKANLLQNLADLIMRVRHPNHLSLMANIRKRFVHSFLHSQI